LCGERSADIPVMSDVNREIRVIFVEDIEVDAKEVEEVLRNDGRPFNCDGWIRGRHSYVN